jgi:hypothetical protein
MLIKAKIALTATIVLCTAFTAAAAATRHHRVAHASPTICNVAPSNISVSTPVCRQTLLVGQGRTTGDELV